MKCAVYRVDNGALFVSDATVVNNDDGSVSVGDIGLAVAGFGTPSPDLNGDGIDSVADIGWVVSSFGLTCP